MNQNFTLSVVDQSPVRRGGTATDALQETIELAVMAEALGYQRYWVAEHHNLPNFASTSPSEVKRDSLIPDESDACSDIEQARKRNAESVANLEC